jgi:hypothetical protein
MIKTRFGAKDVNLTFEGVVTRFTNKYIKRDVKTMSERTQQSEAPYLTMGPCSKGGRVIFEGTPKELLKAKDSLTSAYLGKS